MIDAKQYRDMGARCRLMASEASTLSHKAALLDMAQRWNQLADQVEQTQLGERPANDD